MPQFARAHCKRCGKHRDRVGPISWLGNCRKCGLNALYENIDGIHAKQGEPWRAWRRGMARAAGTRLLDAPEPRGQTRD